MMDSTASASSESHRRLQFKLGRDITPMSPDHKLLVGFHFGSGPVAREHPAIVSLGIDPIDGQDLVEHWWYEGDVEYKVIGNAHISQCADYAVVSLQVPDTSPQDFRACSFHAYKELLSAVQQSKHPNLAKIWNYFPGINDGEGDQEKYRQFSMGRAEAFEKFSIVDKTVPTGTAIGCVREGRLTIIALTSRHDLLSVENPRQVSAFEYPRQYGPRSPKFSRGGCVPAQGHDLLVYSGTAAIVGHKSVHPHDVHLQVGETLENLDHLCKAITALRDEGPALVLDDECVLRVYLRNPGDRDFVAGELLNLLGAIESNVVFLNADICRRELMVEIDGVRVLP